MSLAFIFFENDLYQLPELRIAAFQPLGNILVNRRCMALGDDGKAVVDLNAAFLTEIKTVPDSEEMILRSLANTFGYYFGTDQVILTVEGKPYDSGTTALGEGKALETDFSNAAPVAS
jgi:hypothetical protein